MTVLHNNNFEGLTTNAAPSGWVDPSNTFRVYTYAATSTTAIQGTQAFFSNANATWAVETGIGALADQAVRLATRVSALTTAAFTTVGAVLCSATALSNSNQYRIYLETNNTGLRLTIAKYAGGTTNLVSSTSYAFTPAAGDVIHLEAKRVGNAIEARAWLNSDARPATADNSVSATYATAVITDSTYTSGYAGVYFSGASTYVPADNVVITDAAGGEDFYYASGATASGATLTGVSTIVPGSASGASSGTASGATLTGTSTISAGTATAMASLTTRIFHNNTGTVLANQANCALNIYNATTGALVLRVTGQTTTAAGRLVVSNAALVAGTTYAYELDLTAASLGRRLPLKAAA